MLPIISGGHSAYQDKFMSDFATFYPDPYSISKETWDTIIEFYHLDLSMTDEFMMERYSSRAPKSRQPSCILRSYLLSIKFKINSIKRWVSLLRENPLGVFTS